MDTKQTYCIGGCYYSNTNKLIENKKIILKLTKLLKLENENVIFVDDPNHNLLLSK